MYLTWIDLVKNRYQNWGNIDKLNIKIRFFKYLKHYLFNQTVSFHNVSGFMVNYGLI